VHAAFLAGVIPNDVSPASLKVSGCTFGASGAVACDGTGFPTNNNPSINIVNGFPNVVNVNNVLGKVDFRQNERSTVSGMYFFGNNTGTVEDFPELQSEVAVTYSHPSPGVRSQLGMDTESTLGE